MINVPDFGPLSGVKVLVSGISYAGPFAATLMSDYGADVTFLESSRAPDMVRGGSFFEQAHRNQKSIAINLAAPEGQAVLERMLKESDILIENSKAGQWDKWGLSDDILWESNPKLVIAHVSGFGQTGVKEYTSRGSFDGIGQAFGGLMGMNGEPAPASPLGVNPYVADYYAAIYASWSCLAAYIKALKTGRGDSIDIAQYEALVYTMGDALMNSLNRDTEFRRSGAQNSKYGAWQPYKCLDGEILVVPIGSSSYNKGLPFLGLEIGNEDFPAEWQYVPRGTKADAILQGKISEFCAARTVEQADKELNENNILASPIMTHKMMPEHPQYKARNVITEWEDAKGQKIKGPNTVLRFKNNPGRIWRGAAQYGQDNEAVLGALGYSEAEIKAMYDSGTLAQGVPYKK